MAVPLLPEDKIVDAWSDLKIYPIPDAPAVPLAKFKRYLEKTWIVQRLGVLSVFGQEQRTNNSVESYNARWNARVLVKNPNFWDLAEKIWESFEDISGDIGRLSQDPPVRVARPQRIKNVVNMANLRCAEAELMAGGSSMQFLRKARHTFGRRNKKYFEILQKAIEQDAELGGDIVVEEEEEEPPAHVPEEGGAAGGGPQVDPNHDETLCCICWDRPKDSVIMPCAHQICEECGNNHLAGARNSGQEPTCPYCRQEIWRIARLLG